MKRFSLVVLTLCWLCSWSLMPSILVGPSLAIAADQTILLALNTTTADQLMALPAIGEAPDNTPALDRLRPTAVRLLPPDVTVQV